MAFHLTRETGKIIRIVSRGSQSFATILRMATFNIVPTLIEIIMTLTIIGILFPIEFFAMAATTITLYVVTTICITEWRAKAFKKQA